MKFLSAFVAGMLAVSAAQAIEIAPEVASGLNTQTQTTANKHMVVSAHALASAAGDEILRQGGNAIDATIATQIMLNLVEPYTTGIGGGGFLLYYNNAQHKMYGYDGRETAPAAATSTMFLGADGKAPPYQEALKGGLAVGTPGLLKTLELAHHENGKLPWAALFAPTIRVAKQGFALSPRFYAILQSTPYIAQSPNVRALYFNADGSIKPVGSIIKNQALAQTLEAIAKHGSDAFYKGDIAQHIVQAVQKNPFRPGIMTAADLAGYAPAKREPICESYNNNKICTMPPPTSGGLTILQALKMLDKTPLKTYAPNSAPAVQTIMEALRLSFADRNKYVADCAFVPVPIKGLLNDDYVGKRAALIKTNSTISPVLAGDLPWDKKCTTHPTNEHYSTTHMSVVDAQGNAVTLTSSIEYAFGSGLMVDGFFLNNQMTDFAMQPIVNGVEAANKVEPGKRPRSSMSPVLVFDSHDKLSMVLGSPGGSRIISFVLQTLVSTLTWDIPLHTAINQPHFATTGQEVELEQGRPIVNLADTLRHNGQTVVLGDLTSGLHGIHLKDGKLLSGVDQRREGSAVGE